MGRWLWAHVGCWQVKLYAEDRLLVTHDRRFSNSHWQLDPLHYLDLIARRPASFERARPMLQWRPQWPPAYEVLLSALRRRHGEGRGTQQFIQILALHRDYDRADVQAAVESVLEQQCPSYESVQHLVRHATREPLSMEPLPAELLPGITDRQVGRTAVASFDALLGGGR